MFDATHKAVTCTYDDARPAGYEIKENDTILDFRGDEWRFIGITRVPNGCSTGRVYVEGMGERAYKSEFFPSVFDLVIVPRD